MDFVISCGDVYDPLILTAAKACSAARVLAVKGNHDLPASFTPPIVDLQLKVVTLASGLRIGGIRQGVDGRGAAQASRREGRPTGSARGHPLLPVQHLTHLAGQIVPREGLRQERYVGAQCATLCHHVGSVAGHEQALQLGMLCS